MESNEQIEKGFPPVDFATEGLRLSMPAELTAPLPDGSVRALEHLLLALAPTVVACDPSDLEATSDATTIWLYDSFGGGLGISRPSYERLEEILGLGLRVVRDCGCAAGCPSCIALSRRPDGNAGLSKVGAVSLLEALVDG